ncbi:MAG: radical SAM protein [Promethearchaeota archaeon]
MKTKGTKEWASSNVNIGYGCSNDCKYCYAKRIAIRFRRKTYKNWREMELNYKAIYKNYRKRMGRIMFPTSHDITPMILDQCIFVLNKLLKVGNNILITTKPNFYCIEKICKTLNIFKERVQFRFTITSINNKLLKKFEPGAPKFEERLKCLKYAYKEGFKTSVSIEPFLDYDPIPLILAIQNFITESIWIGPMNYYHFPELKYHYTKKHLLEIYQRLKNVKKIRFKDSFLSIINKQDNNVKNEKLINLFNFR